MSERPTEALRRKIAGDPDVPESLASIIDAIDARDAALTAEVGRLREGIDYALTAGTYGVMEGRLRALTPIAEQPAPATKPDLDHAAIAAVLGSTYEPYDPAKHAVGAKAPPVPATKPCGHCAGGAMIGGCDFCRSTGRVPAPETADHFSDAGKMVEPPPGADARTDDGRFVSGTGYGGERR